MSRFTKHSILRQQSLRQGNRRPVRNVRPSVEPLEDRCVPTVSTIISNFNGTAIPAGDTVWFSSVFKVNGLHSGATVNLYVTNQTITLNGAAYPVPDAHITFSPATPPWAATTFTNSTWSTTLPMSFSGNGFLGGFALPVPNGLPGGLNPVSWKGEFSSDTTGLSVNWQWAAAVYTNFGTDYNALGVKPADDNHLGQYQNSDHAGTPEAFTSYVTGGARGGGGSNYTGSYSATASVSPSPYVPPCNQPASVSGKVTNQNTHSGFAGVTVTLTGTDFKGNQVTLTTTTAADGTYSFANLAAGTYSLTATIPTGYFDSGDLVGTVNGTTDGTRTVPAEIDTISLNSGDNGLGYNFGFYLPTG